MSIASLEACATLVRRADPDRYFSALFAPAATRPLLLALYALNAELARIAESVREPMLGEIRLQWWREALEEARAGRARRHDVAEGMVALFAAADLPQDLLDTMIDARAFDFSTDEFADDAALDAYLEATSGTLMKLAARVLDPGGKLDACASQAGTAFGLVGTARALAHHASRGKILIPQTALKSVGIQRDHLFAPENRDALAGIARAMASRATALHEVARKGFGKSASLPALLPAALVPLYARRIRRTSYDPHDPDVGLHRRLTALLVAAARGGI